LENQDYIEKIEANERKLRTLLKDKNSGEGSNENLQDKLMDVRKQLNTEKRKNIDLSERNNSV